MSEQQFEAFVAFIAGTTRHASDRWAEFNAPLDPTTALHLEHVLEQFFTGLRE